MLSSVSVSKFEKCYPTRLKKYFRSNINYLDYEKLMGDKTKSIIGNLPSNIIEAFCCDKKEGVLDFQTALSDVSDVIRDRYFKAKIQRLKYWDFNLLPKEQKQNLDTYFSNYFNERVKHLFPKGTKFYLQYVNRGAFKLVFRLSMVDKEYNRLIHDKALQICVKRTDEMLGLKDRHNIFAETNWWYFLTKNCGHRLDKTQFSRYYLSDMRSRYMLTEFIDNGISPTTSFVNILKIFGVHCADSKYNDPILGKLYDGGGYLKTNDFIGDKVVLRYFKKLFHQKNKKELQKLIEDIQTRLLNPRTPHRDKIQKALDIFESRCLNKSS